MKGDDQTRKRRRCRTSEAAGRLFPAESLAMTDPRDFLTLCRLGAPGLGLLVLGLAGVIVQKKALRRALSFAVLMTGALLLTDAAARLHRLSPSPVRSLTFLTIASAPVLFAIVRTVSANRRSSPDSPDESHNAVR